MNNSVLEDSYKWRRQKNYETEISTLNDKLRKMQEKLEGLQQKQLQGDLFRGKTSLPD
jgi:Skp family chaperone for outer membrane proteins